MFGVTGGYLWYCGGPASGSVCAFVFRMRKRTANGFRMTGECHPLGSLVRDIGNYPRPGSVDRSLAKYSKVYIIQPYREHEKCAPACQNAIGHECQCSCMGLYHGAGNDGSWFEVSETFATR
jgi:hypothetical protein